MSRTGRAVLLWTALQLLAATSCAPAGPERAAGPLTPCLVPGTQDTVGCGTLLVPEVHGVPATRRIPLRVIVIPSTAPKAEPTPWVELVGGPGNAATDYAAAFLEDLGYIRRERDVVLVDQRGTGGSHPLYCPELSRHQVSSFPPRFPLEAVATCRSRLSATADLGAYSTAAAAEDLEAVRRWLGYPQLNLFGSSYGTRVALEYMRRYPARTRSAILWGVVPPTFRRPLYYPMDGQRALDKLLAQCAADPACAAAYPELRADLDAMWRRVDRQPVPVALLNPASGESVHTALTRAGLAQAIWSALAYPDRARRLPFIIHQAARGDFAPLHSLDVATTAPARRYYNGMHLSVVCPEEVLQNSGHELVAASRGSFMPEDRGLEYEAACRAWGVAKADSGSLAPVTVTVPTLIVSGDMDPITPPAWGAEAAADLPRSRHVIAPHLSHESSGLRGVSCLDSLFVRFVRSPEPSALVADCVANIQPPPFTLPPAPRPGRR